MYTKRLGTARQVTVGNRIKGGLAADRPTPLTPATIARGEAVVAATTAVSLFANLGSGKVDRATDRVVVGFERMLTCAGEWVLHASVLPHGPDQQTAAGRIGLVHTRLFADGTEFTRGSMDAQWSGLVTLRSRMEEPDVAAAIDALGLRPLADHVLAHVDLYGRMLGQQGGKSTAGEEQANAAWHEAFRVFAAQVVIDYHADAAIQEELLGVYDAQVEQQRAVARADRLRRARAADQPEPATDEESAPPPTQPTGGAPAVA